MTEYSGKTIGRYQVAEPVGKGGMASVYKAFDTRLERYVAIKFIRAEGMDQEVFLKRFEREAKALAKLSHPNIVRVLDYGNHENIPYIVMEYVPGGTLKDRLGSPLPPAEAARLILPIAKALEYTHRHGIIHRDVKPANFLIMDNGEPVLSDFGIARLVDQSSTSPLTGTGTGIGTPEYMSPEQCRGDQIDQRTDVYSLGVVFYELITGAKPFSADTPMGVVMKQIHEPLMSPDRYVPGLPREIESILQKALAKDPANRYPDMQAFIETLEKISTGRSNFSEYQTVKHPPVDQPLYAPQEPALPSPVYNLPAVEAPAPAGPSTSPEPPRNNRMIWWIGGGFAGLVLCAVTAAALLIGGNMLSSQQSANSTGTAQSLAFTIEAHQVLQTGEADRQTSTAVSVLAEQTRQASDASATALAVEQNQHATSTAQVQSATQSAQDAIVADFQRAENNWNTVFSDDFNIAADWNTGYYESEWWEGSKTISNGSFIWEMLALQGFYHYVTVNDINYADFLVRLVCGQTSGNENGETGLVMMQTDNEKYYFTINNHSQLYEFFLYQSGEWTTLSSNISDVINTNDLNTVAIKAENNVFTIFINDEFVEQIADDSVLEGQIGIAAGLFSPEERGSFKFDTITIQTP